MFIGGATAALNNGKGDHQSDVVDIYNSVTDQWRHERMPATHNPSSGDLNWRVPRYLYVLS
jgi:hypothetical protein